MIGRQPRFVHVAWQQQQTVDLSAVERALQVEALDWLRYATNCYILWTSSEPQVIAGRLMTVPGMAANSFLVSRLDFTDGYGSFPDWIWQWIRQDRSGRSVYTLPPLPPVAPPARRP
jgi:hypothetical protein